MDYVHRVAQKEGIADFNRNVPDHISVDMMMQQMASGDQNSSILLYRPQTDTERLMVVIQVETSICIH